MLLKQSAFSKITKSDAENTFLDVNSNFETIQLISCSPEELKKGLVDDYYDVFSAILRACPSINEDNKVIIFPKGLFREKLWWELPDKV